MRDPKTARAARFLRSQCVVWARDWDAILIGFVVGVLVGKLL